MKTLYTAYSHQLHHWFFTLSRWQKRILMILMDMIILPFAVWLSFALRLNTWTPDLKDGVWLLLIAPLVSIPVFVRLGLYRAIIRFLGHQALNAVFYGTSITVIVMIAATALFELQGVPRSVFIIYFGTAFLLLGGTRHWVRRYYHSGSNQSRRINVAIYGAGHSGAQLALSLFSSRDYRPVLFLDDEKSLQGSYIHGLKVHRPQDCVALIENYQLKQILLAMPSVEPGERRKILRTLEPLPIHVRSIPRMEELLAGKPIESLREISIDEILGRTSVAPEPHLLKHCISNKNVMVTGAGGSIGSELCRQIIRLNPVKLVLFEICEFSLYQIEQELNQLIQHKKIEIQLIPIIGSVQNQQRIEDSLKTHQIQALYHAAAYKHVPLVEHNPIEGIQNNVLGTWRTACAAYKQQVQYFVLISTDKAVRPTNIMGASKRMAELGLQALASTSAHTTFSIVRFGNVLGSSGSVVPLFTKQINAGGPITVTHPEITRYFMTIPEAAELVIQAGAMSQGGEVFLLDMGHPVKIQELAQRMIRLHGLQEKTQQTPDGDIEIVFSGLRPGEKLYEELLIENNAQGTEHPRIFQATENKISLEEYQQVIESLTAACNQRHVYKLHRLFHRYVSGYNHAALHASKIIPLPVNPEPISKAG